MCLDVFVRVNTIGVRLPFVWKFRIVTFVLWSLFMCTSSQSLRVPLSADLHGLSVHLPPLEVPQ
jgi:hypothetical protein